MYLMIQNPGEAPVEGFTILGVSTTRNSGNADTIGHFGSGSKHAVNILLRQQINPVIYCGNLKLDFFIKAETINDGLDEQGYAALHCKLSGKNSDNKAVNKTINLNFSLEYGYQDWDDIVLGLREFVSNALDRTIRQEGDYQPALKHKRLQITPVEDNQVRAKKGYTRIFVPFTYAVEQFYNQLGKRFLHFSNPELLKKRILPKTDQNLSENSSAVVYKKGVLVREVYSPGTPSVFDYNFGDELTLDESRQVNDSTITAHVGKLLLNQASKEHIASIYKRLISGDSVWEGRIGSYYINADHLETFNKTIRKQVFQQAWEEAAGDGILCGSGSHEQELVSKKGYRPIALSSSEWISVSESFDIPSYMSVLTQDEQQGRKIVNATPTVEKVLDAFWETLEYHNLTENKEKPKAKCFTQIMDAGCTVYGYYTRGGDTIYINTTIADGITINLIKTVAEEVTHYVTQATDMSRDFQDYAFLCLARLFQKEIQK